MSVYSYEYNELGQRVKRTQSTDLDLDGNPDATSTDSFIYDADGNLASDGIWAYTWNGENRLINADNGAISIDFEYDYQGRLVKKDDGTNVEVYLYDGWNRARRVRVEFPGAVYHVINRGNYRSFIFETAGARKSFIECLDQCCVSQGWVLHAWVLMLLSPAFGQ